MCRTRQRAGTGSRGARCLCLWILFFVSVAFQITCQQPHLQPPSDPQRIVSLKPNLTEILFALGAGERVVGVTKHCLWPEAAKAKPKIGDYAFADLEKILALQPDLVVTLKEASSPRLVEILGGARIPVVIFETDNFAGIWQTIAALGAILHLEKASEQLTADLQAALASLATATHPHPPKKALVVLQRRPLIVAGQNTFLAELLRVAGAHNIVPVSALAYPHLSMEQVLAWQPEIILDLDPSSTRQSWAEYDSLPAVQKGELYFLSPNLFIPGPRLAQTAQMIAHAIYPDLR